MGSSTSLREIDVLVVGAGPAGATVALNLAPLRRVALIDRQARPGPRIGESLPPAARRLLTDMGLLESFTAENHSPCYGNRAAWGSAQPVETDFMRDPDSHGWHIDRARFEVWLRAVAVDRGTLLLAPARMQSMEWDGRRWRVRLATAAGSAELIAQLVIDAGGRAAPIARVAGARRKRYDRLFCSWLYGEADPCGRGAGLTYVEAQEHGWWYTAPVPGGRRVLAFHTDADLPEARAFADPKRLPQRVAPDGELAAILSESRFTPADQCGVTAAHSAVLHPFAGPSWLAVGDAALSFDPLSSQGLLNALYSGLAAAECAERRLAGDADALPQYLDCLARVHTAYRANLARWYRVETRWTNSPFWKRRRRPIAAADV
jgi:flavin-dependent dehydrogenase